MSALPEDAYGMGPTNFLHMKKSLNQTPISRFDTKWKGKLVQLEVYQISIKHLRYNLNNTRVLPHLREYGAKNGHPKSYFEKIDKDSITTQKLIDSFLRKNADRKAALKFFKQTDNKPETQHPFVCTPDGRILNGNQRLCVFRELYFGDQKKYSHLQTAYVAFLPDNGTAEDERNLEAIFQDTELTGAKFDWVQAGLYAYEELKKPGVTTASLAKTRGVTEAEMLAEVGRIKLAREFLIYMEMEDYWHTLREMNLLQAFKTLYEKMNAEKEILRRNQGKELSFAMMKDPKEAGGEAGTSLHLLIGKVFKNIQTLEVEGTPEPKTTGPSNALLKPRRKKKGATKRPKEKIDVQNETPAQIARKITEVEEIRKKDHDAKVDATFATRQLKSAVTSFDGIIERWESQNKKGLKTPLKRAIRQLNKIQKMLDKE